MRNNRADHTRHFKTSTHLVPKYVDDFQGYCGITCFTIYHCISWSLNWLDSPCIVTFMDFSETYLFLLLPIYWYLNTSIFLQHGYRLGKSSPSPARRSLQFSQSLEPRTDVPKPATPTDMNIVSRVQPLGEDVNHCHLTLPLHNHISW